MTADVFEHWLVAAIVLMVALVPCALVVFRGAHLAAVVGLQQASTVTVIALVAIAQAFERRWFHDLAVTLAVLQFGGAMVFNRLLGRWL